MSKAGRKQEARQNAALQQYKAGCEMVKAHPLFRRLIGGADMYPAGSHMQSENSLAVVTKDDCIFCNVKRRADPAEWACAIAHCLLHLAMGHCAPHEQPEEWNIACDCVVENFLNDLKFGKPWYEGSPPHSGNDEEKLYRRLCAATGEEKAGYSGFGTAGKNALDIVFKEHRTWHRMTRPKWAELFAGGLSAAVEDAVREVAESWKTSGDQPKNSFRVESARQWFIARYPLLGALAANFKIIEDPLVCMRMQIHIATVSPALSEMYLNSGAHLSTEGLHFVMAHEYTAAVLQL